MELNNLQTSYKNLNKKFGQSIGEKEAQIQQFQQSLVCKLIIWFYFIFFNCKFFLISKHF